MKYKKLVNPNYFNDTSIFKPKDDGLGIDGFAKTLARSFRELKSPIGSVKQILSTQF